MADGAEFHIVIGQEVNLFEVGDRVVQTGLGVPAATIPRGWPFGYNPVLTRGVAPGEPMVVDRIQAPAHYRTVEWRIYISDDQAEPPIAAWVQVPAIFYGQEFEFNIGPFMGLFKVFQVSINILLNDGFAELVITTNYQSPVDVRCYKTGVFENYNVVEMQVNN